MEPIRRELPKIGRNDVVTIRKGMETKELKFKKAEALILNEGWQIVAKQLNTRMMKISLATPLSIHNLSGSLSSGQQSSNSHGAQLRWPQQGLGKIKNASWGSFYTTLPSLINTPGMLDRHRLNHPNDRECLRSG